tara:strand:- start:320 stop:1324 length:1005 start_codon:yes stop_codon:yes gene_type:complete
MNEIKPYKKKIFCCNCGKFGHKYSKCNEPITSLGIIAIKPNTTNDYELLIEYFNSKKYFNLVKSNTMNNNILLKINTFIDKFKFLMIRRRKTLGYIEFIRGRYDVKNSISYITLFEQMIPSEINDLINNSFDYLWNDLWINSNLENKYVKNEFEESKLKFDILKNNNLSNLIKSIKFNYNTPEWGFPKGRRIYLEKNINCACREFEEETSLTKNDYNLLINLPPIQEIFYGTNKILYKHIYYFAICKPSINVKMNYENINQQIEIGDIGWFDYNQSKSLIRKYHFERIKILNESFIFLSSILDKQNINNNDIITDDYEESINSNNLLDNNLIFL